MSQEYYTNRYKKLIKRERAKMMSGKGAFREAKEQLDGEAAENHHRNWKPLRKRRQYSKGSRTVVSDWAEDTATMLYNRKQRRNNVQTKANDNQSRDS